MKDWHSTKTPLFPRKEESNIFVDLQGSTRTELKVIVEVVDSTTSTKQIDASIYCGVASGVSKPANQLETVYTCSKLFDTSVGGFEK